MKHLFTFLLILISLLPAKSQTQTTYQMTFGGNQRSFMVCLPAGFDSTQSVPLIIGLHGLGDNISNFSQVGMQQLAAFQPFVTVYPQAMNSIAGTAWNSGINYSGILINGNIDDVGFINALIDTLSNWFTIDQSRIYAFGFSMGGFMSNRLACQLSNRIAAIASVAGTIGNALTCNPSKPISVAHFHGTADMTVGYSNNNYGMNAEALVDFWSSYNHCDSPATHTAIPDTTADNYTVDVYDYPNGWSESEVVFYKVNGADHVWLSPVVNDISYTLEIYKFFMSHYWVAGVRDLPAEITLFKNPVDDRLAGSISEKTGNFNYAVFSSAGLLVKKGVFNGGDFIIDVSNLPAGQYLFAISGAKGILGSSKFVVAR